MVRLKNIWTAALSVFRPAGNSDALPVEPGQVAEVPGELAADQPHPDAIAVDIGGERRLYSTAQWEHVPGVDMDATPSEVPGPVTETTPEREPQHASTDPPDATSVRTAPPADPSGEVR